MITEKISIDNDIGQGDSLSPLLFSCVMNEVIKSIRKWKEYRIGNKNVRILYDAADAVLIAGNEDDLQKTQQEHLNGKYLQQT